MTTRMNIAVRGLFATPVAALEVPGAEARNAELSAIILKKRETTPSVQASNAGGWHSDREIAVWGGPQVAFILDLAKEMANRLTADRNGKSVQPKWSVMAWANVNGPGDGNICHYHPGAFWSGTYYVADGGCATDPSLGGEFEMLDPRGRRTRNVRADFKIHGRRRPVGRRGGDHQAATGPPVPVSLVALSSSPTLPRQRSAHLHRIQSQRLKPARTRRMSVPASRASKRQSQIITLLRQSGRVAVEDLAAHFSVALQTIRRDLNELSEAGQVVRVHGGAIVASGVENLAYEARQLVAHDQKRLIGEAAARLIPDNSSLFINIGTTTEEVAKALSRHSGLLVITNNLHVASELHRSSAIEIFLTGGTVRQSDGGIVGAVTVEQIEQFRVDFAVIGTSAIDQTGTLLDFDIREVEISRAIVEHARKIILVSDSSKFSRSAPVRIAHLSEIDVFVTDRLPSPAIIELCERCDVKVIEVGGPVESDGEDS